MDHYAGIDVSLEYSSVCVVDVSGKIVREGKQGNRVNGFAGRPRHRDWGRRPYATPSMLPKIVR